MIRQLVVVLIALALFAAPQPRDVAPSIITVGPNVQVSVSMPLIMHSEGVIAADPTDARRLLVCSLIHEPAIGKGVVAYLSQDGGRQWDRKFTTGPDDNAGDPACAYGPDGTAYVMFIPLSGRKSGLPVFRSSDGGRTWTGTGATGYLDRETILVDGTSGPYHGRVYVHGTTDVRSTEGIRRSTIALYASTDGGRTFGPRVERASLGRHYIFASANSVVLSDGRWITAFAEFKEFWEDAESDRVHMTFAPPPEPAYVWLRAIASDDGGTSLTDPITIAEWHAPNGYARYSPAIPSLAADTKSSLFRDRIYVVWPDTRLGGTDVLFSYSTDRGRTWSRPIVINDDRRRPPPAVPPNHLLASVAVNDAGVVAVTWLDRRDVPDRLAWRARIRVSVDGGETFQPSVLLSEAPARFDGTEHWSATSSTAGGGSSLFRGGLLQSQVFAPGHLYMPGDYAAVAADRDGVFHPYWIDNRTGWHQVWTAAVSVAEKAVKNGADDLAGLDDLTPSTTLDRVSANDDRRTQTTTMTVRLRNAGNKRINGPFKIRLISVESDVGNVEVAGASNGLTGPGAVWDVTSYVDGGYLDPGSASRAFTFVFRLHDVRPFAQGHTDRFTSIVVRFFTRVLGHFAS
ncbi:MAG: hypothetical protein DMF85_11625 [Acidobacteria bacterium]|nr:MAG: hypothetical protein DMF85_11625 [Acidobacteriota bacterium]